MRSVVLLVGGSVLVLWFVNLRAGVKQRRLTTAICSLIERINANSPDIFQNDERRLAEAKQRIVSSSINPLTFIYPGKYLRDNTDVASVLLQCLEFKDYSLSDEYKASVSRLLDSEQKLLAHRLFTQKRKCKHGGSAGSIVALSRKQQGNMVFWNMWCRYCLASWHQTEQVPVIVRPPY